MLCTLLAVPALDVRAQAPDEHPVPLRPFVTCVEAIPGAKLRVHWGYLNTTKSDLQRALGPDNRLSSAGASSPPTTFRPGFTVEAFSSEFAQGAQSSWSLDGIAATANARSHRCTAAQKSASPSELINPAPGAPLFLGANFWNLDWQGSQEYFVDQPRFASGSSPWLPQFLRDLEPYHVLRFMDWNLTNDADNPQSRWTTRRPKGQAQREPIAYEWQIDLCNRTHKDCWLTVPHAASTQYFSQLAQLVREQLDASLRVYVEWSNEVWNGSFPQHEYAGALAAQLGLAGEDPAAAYQVYQSVRLFEAFTAVFGADNPRVVRVLAGQAGYVGPCKAQLAALTDPKINPKHTRPDVYAIAPYVHGRTLQELRSTGMARAKAGIAENLRCARGARLPLIAYEGGQDSFALGVEACERLQRDQGMRALYAALPDALAAAGLRGPFVHYTHSGACWGLKVKTTDSNAASPKYQGLLDWQRKQSGAPKTKSRTSAKPQPAAAVTSPAAP